MRRWLRAAQVGRAGTAQTTLAMPVASPKPPCGKGACGVVHRARALRRLLAARTRLLSLCVRQLAALLLGARVEAHSLHRLRTRAVSPCPSAAPTRVRGQRQRRAGGASAAPPSARAARTGAPRTTRMGGKHWGRTCAPLPARRARPYFRRPPPAPPSIRSPASVHFVHSLGNKHPARVPTPPPAACCFDPRDDLAAAATAAAMAPLRTLIASACAVGLLAATFAVSGRPTEAGERIAPPSQGRQTRSSRRARSRWVYTRFTDLLWGGRDERRSAGDSRAGGFCLRRGCASCAPPPRGCPP